MVTLQDTSWLGIAALLLYCSSASLLMIYGLNCYWVVYLFSRSWKKAQQENQNTQQHFDQQFDHSQLPVITTQIPLYNEYNVAARIIQAVAAIDYPLPLHEIQVLDDSNDETCQLVDRTVQELQQKGHRISVIRRPNRQGFKAGALQYGMEQCAGEYIAIFDSDFVPSPSFLKEALPILLQHPQCGLAQARWGHLNAKQSLLTFAQSMGIDGHFMVEQSARANNRLFMNFNGTAGLWRKQAITEAGGWQADTLTEDMDLSYRSQLAGWQLQYLPHLEVPAEIPESFTAFKSQQFRWAKGSIQTALKIYPRVLRSQHSAMAKLQAFFHLTHYSIHPLMLIMALCSLPVLLMVQGSLIGLIAWGIALLIFLAMAGPNALYCVSQKTLYPHSWGKRILMLPALMCVGVGIAISNSRAVAEALLGIQSQFIRTPKKGDRKQTQKKYTVRRNSLAYLEIALGLYCFVSLWFYIQEQKYLVGPFLLVYALGFSLVGISSWIENRQQQS